MQRQVANPLAERVLSGAVPDGARVEVGVAERGGASQEEEEKEEATRAEAEPAAA